MRTSLIGGLVLGMVAVGCGEAGPAAPVRGPRLSAQAAPATAGRPPDPATLGSWAANFAGFGQAPSLLTALGRLGAGGLGAPLPITGWPGMGHSGLATAGGPGWGRGAAAPYPATGGTWGMTPLPGQYNLSRGAADVGGWGLDAGFFTIPQQEQRQRQQQARTEVNRDTAPPAGMTRLDTAKFPFLRPVKGPLVPPK